MKKMVDVLLAKIDITEEVYKRMRKQIPFAERRKYRKYLWSLTYEQLMRL